MFSHWLNFPFPSSLQSYSNNGGEILNGNVCFSWLWLYTLYFHVRLWNCGVGEDSWESLGLQEDQTSQFWRESPLNIHWKDWCWSWSSSTLATWCRDDSLEKTLMLGKIEGRRRRGWQRMRWLDSSDSMAINLCKLQEWRTEEPGVLQSIRKELDTTQWLNNKFSCKLGDGLQPKPALFITDS